jgi:hypothetical protein
MEVTIFGLFRFPFTEFRKHGDGDMENGDMETLRHGDMDMETWRHKRENKSPGDFP